MENYISLTLFIPEQQHEDYIFYLIEHGAEGFEQSNNQLIAYFKENDFHSSILKKFDENSYRIDKILPTNWNETWESNFPKVEISGICEIYASHHTPSYSQPFSIHIQPQMSFGTGHHFTTQLMIRLIHESNLEDKKILDMGAGTGILGIFAILKKAKEVTFIDIENWAVQNIHENLLLNQLPNQTIICGDHTAISENFDIIFANINKNILIEHAPYYYKHLVPLGDLFLSGFFDFDEKIILKTYSNLGFELVKKIEDNGWIALQLKKNETRR